MSTNRFPQYEKWAVKITETLPKEMIAKILNTENGTSLFGITSCKYYIYRNGIYMASNSIAGTPIISEEEFIKPKHLIFPVSFILEGFNAMSEKQIQYLKEELDIFSCAASYSAVVLFYNTMCCDEWRKRLDAIFPYANLALQKTNRLVPSGALEHLRAFNTEVFGRSNVIYPDGLTNDKQDGLYIEKGLNPKLINMGLYYRLEFNQ